MSCEHHSHSRLSQTSDPCLRYCTGWDRVGQVGTGWDRTGQGGGQGGTGGDGVRWGGRGSNGLKGVQRGSKGFEGRGSRNCGELLRHYT